MQNEQPGLTICTILVMRDPRIAPAAIIPICPQLMSELQGLSAAQTQNAYAITGSLQLQHTARPRQAVQ